MPQCLANIVFFKDGHFKITFFFNLWETLANIFYCNRSVVGD